LVLLLGLEQGGPNYVGPVPFRDPDGVIKVKVIYQERRAINDNPL
jgi:hypothetical protein